MFVESRPGHKYKEKQNNFKKVLDRVGFCCYNIDIEKRKTENRKRGKQNDEFQSTVRND
jgi:hypothetical protein